MVHTLTRWIPLACCAALGACSAAPPREAAVTTAAGAAARAHAPGTVRVHLRGVVTYSERRWGHLFVQDATGAVAAYSPALALDPLPGTTVEVTGRLTPDAAALQPPAIADPVVRWSGAGPMPEPRRIALQQLATACDGRWVETAGIVASADVWEGYLRLAIVSGGERAEVRVRDYPAFDFRTLVGVPIGVRGVCVPARTADAFARRRLFVSGFADVAPRTPGGTAAGAVPIGPGQLRTLTRVKDIRRLTRAEASRQYPIDLTAVVTYADPAWVMLWVQDETGGIYVQTHGEAKLKPRIGDVVAIQGASAPGNFAPEIVRAVIAVRGRARLPAPTGVPTTELFTGSRDSQFVSVRGVVRRVSRGSQDHLQVEMLSEGVRFQVIAPPGREPLPVHLVDA